MAPKSMNSNKALTLPDRQDEQGFDLLYEFYKPKLFIIVNSYIPSREDAEEIVHDVLIRIWEKKDRIRVHSNLTAYLYSMTRNACLDYLRARKSKLSKEINIHQQEHSLNYNAMADETASSILLKELQALVKSGIDELPEKCKSVFVKSRMEGLNHKEISEELHISPKTVENHISRALRHLRTTLKEYLPLF
jgi:RNA polymerase sigma-70 factor (ECF subfamily)